MKKDNGAVSGFAFGIMTMLFVGAMMILSINYSMAARTKYNVENAMVESAFAGFRANEDYYVSDGNLQLSNDIFNKSRYSFINFLKRNLNLQYADNTNVTALVPKQDSYIPYADADGNLVTGQLTEFYMYEVSGKSNASSEKIQHYEWRNGAGQTYARSFAGDITYGGETVLKKEELVGNETDRMLILCAKVTFPQTNILRMGTTYSTKTCCVRWKSRHAKKQEA